MKTEDKLELLLDKLRWLRLPGMTESLREILNTANKKNHTVVEILSQLCDEEKRSRLQRAVKNRMIQARFPEVNTLDGFDFEYSPARKKIRARYLALHEMTFLKDGVNPLFIGTPGTGKTYLARALAYAACQHQKRVAVISATKMLNELHGADIHGVLEKTIQKYVKAELLLIDDFAVLAMDETQAKLAFQVISERYDHRRSIIITTNRPFKDWPKVFPDALNAQVIAERLIERSESFVLEGRGYGTRGGSIE